LVPHVAQKFVATKTADQLDLQALHRLRELFGGQRALTDRRPLPVHPDEQTRAPQSFI
jgi:hypothetical protein